MSFYTNLRGSQLDGYFKKSSSNLSIQDQQKKIKEDTPSKIFSSKVPNDILFLAATFLDHRILMTSYSHVNKEHNSISNEIIASYVKP